MALGTSDLASRSRCGHCYFLNETHLVSGNRRSTQRHNSYGSRTFDLYMHLSNRNAPNRLALGCAKQPHAEISKTFSVFDDGYAPSVPHLIRHHRRDFVDDHLHPLRIGMDTVGQQQ